MNKFAALLLLACTLGARATSTVALSDCAAHGFAVGETPCSMCTALTGVLGKENNQGVVAACRSCCSPISKPKSFRRAVVRMSAAVPAEEEVRNFMERNLPSFVSKDLAELEQGNFPEAARILFLDPVRAPGANKGSSSLSGSKKKAQEEDVLASFDISKFKTEQITALLDYYLYKPADLEDDE
jgi:hypothetical protein